MVQSLSRGHSEGKDLVKSWVVREGEDTVKRGHSEVDPLYIYVHCSLYLKMLSYNQDIFFFLTCYLNLLSLLSY